MVKHADAVDEVILPAEVSHVIKGHVVEDGIVGVTDEVGLFGALLCDLESLAREIEGIKVSGAGVEMGEILSGDTRAAPGVKDLNVVVLGR